MLLFSGVLFIESPYRSTFARAVLFNREIVGSITLRSLIRAKGVEGIRGSTKGSEKLFQAQG